MVRKTLKVKKTDKMTYPKTDDVRLTFFMDDLIMPSKQYPRGRLKKDVTDKEIIDYMKTLTMKSLHFLKSEIEDVKTYMGLDNKINFKPLTIDYIKKNLYNKKTKKWKSIKYYYPDGDNPNDPHYGPIVIQNPKDRNKRDKVFCNTFTPNGDLIETDSIDYQKKHKKIYKDWLLSNKSGPYKYKHTNYKNENNKFYYLDGNGEFCNEDKHKIPIQVCQSNYVSDNCISGPSWIETDKDEITNF